MRHSTRRRGSLDRDTPAARGQGPARRLPLRQAGPARRRRREPDDLSRARRSPSWASPARASRRWRTPIIDLLPGNGRSPAARSCSRDATSPRPTARRILALRGSSIGLVPQDPMSNLNPLWTVGFQIKEALKANGVADGQGGRRARRRAARGGRTARRRAPRPAVSARVLRRHAPARAHRHGPGGAPEAADRRRADVGARRHRAEADPRPPRHSSPTSSASRCCSSPTTSAWPPSAPTTWSVMYRGAIVESGPAAEILQRSAAPVHPAAGRDGPVAGVAAAVLGARSRRGARAGRRRRRSEIAEQVAESSDELGEGTDDIIVAEDLTKVFTLPGRRPGSRSTSPPSTTSRSGCGAAPPRRSSASRARASPRVARMVLDLLEPTSGEVLFDGIDVAALKGKEPLRLRRRCSRSSRTPTPRSIRCTPSTSRSRSRCARTGSATKRSARPGCATCSTRSRCRLR